MVADLLLWGALGQLVRSAVGLRKAALRGDKLNFPKWFSSVILGAIVGAGVGVVLQPYVPVNTWIVSFFAGYAGTDYLEGLTEKRVI
ncbi:MAG: hypothetical protein QW507_03415 [Candidatus Nanoarchaeia archaeon]|nr:hypothetical protein [Candidatus Haiyanarchaeum thermophilum]MCW1302871.1 hypothetical protein [Candidatus Haiyanarchaeum thermophilum]MCW1303551.1 hypothetical protein [Candidatus Haiyanarchaeum thermophilum]MCW1306233.1 hypothetical protein [Candidatus Haiyanarchaeum thermophilum]MCW1307313.1 hypothetical protein [Candidatus Haiyanarchaeum thermophilum]